MEQDSFYKTHVFVCTNERPPGAKRGCCKAKGADDLRNYLKVRAKEEGIAGIRVNAAGCLDRCELGVTMVIYPEGAWYTLGSRADADEVLESHIKNGVPVARLLLQNGQDELTPEQKEGRV